MKTLPKLKPILSQLLVVGVLVSVDMPLHAKEVLGKVFFSPAERAEMDRLSKAPQPSNTNNDIVPTSSIQTYRGELKRQDGYRVRWLYQNDGLVQEVVSKTSPSSTPKIGQTIDTKTGQTQADILPQGSIVKDRR
jgi:hypothetical protein